MNFISIKDKLPPEQEYVLVTDNPEKSDTFSISIGRHRGGKWTLIFDIDDNDMAPGDIGPTFKASAITHWFPLPAT